MTAPSIILDLGKIFMDIYNIFLFLSLFIFGVTTVAVSRGRKGMNQQGSALDMGMLFYSPNSQIF